MEVQVDLDVVLIRGHVLVVGRVVRCELFLVLGSQLHSARSCPTALARCVRSVHPMNLCWRLHGCLPIGCRSRSQAR